MLTGAVAGIAAGRMQLGEGSQSQAPCLAFTPSRSRAPGPPVPTSPTRADCARFVEHACIPGLTVVTRGVGVGSALGAALSAASFTAEGRCVHVVRSARCCVCKSYALGAGALRGGFEGWVERGTASHVYFGGRVGCTAACVQGGCANLWVSTGLLQLDPPQQSQSNLVRARAR